MSLVRMSLYVFCCFVNKYMPLVKNVTFVYMISDCDLCISCLPDLLTTIKRFVNIAHGATSNLLFMYLHVYILQVICQTVCM